MTFQGINGAVRDEMLLQLTVPVIFVQVKASNFCLFSLKEHLLSCLHSQNMIFQKVNYLIIQCFTMF